MRVATPLRRKNAETLAKLSTALDRTLDQKVARYSHQFLKVFDIVTRNENRSPPGLITNADGNLSPAKADEIASISMFERSVERTSDTIEYVSTIEAIHFVRVA